MFNVELLTAKNLPKVITGYVTSRIIFCIEGKNSRFLKYSFIFIGSTPILTSKSCHFRWYCYYYNYNCFHGYILYEGKVSLSKSVAVKAMELAVLAITNKPIIGMKLYLLTHNWCPAITLLCCDNQNSIVSIILLI